jgi:microcystin-dependent protein
VSETRSLDDLTSALAALTAEVADMKSTATARDGRMPTGDTELAFRASPKAGTLFMQGQTLDRVEYAALWAWAQANGVVVPGGYGVGNGTTTFTLPDVRGKVIRGVAVGGALGEQVGADSRALTEAQMPVHDHTATATTDSHSHGGSVGSAGSHSHDSSGGEMGSSGSHGAHNGGSANYWQSLNDGQGLFTVPTAFNNSGGGHTHSFTFDINSAGAHTHTITTSADGHTHTITVANAGGTTPVDLRQASTGWHVAVWT